MEDSHDSTFTPPVRPWLVGCALLVIALAVLVYGYIWVNQYSRDSLDVDGGPHTNGLRQLSDEEISEIRRTLPVRIASSSVSSAPKSTTSDEQPYYEALTPEEINTITTRTNYTPQQTSNGGAAGGVTVDQVSTQDGASVSTDNIVGQTEPLKRESDTISFGDVSVGTAVTDESGVQTTRSGVVFGTDADIMTLVMLDDNTELRIIVTSETQIILGGGLVGFTTINRRDVISVTGMLYDDVELHADTITITGTEAVGKKRNN